MATKYLEQETVEIYANDLAVSYNRIPSCRVDKGYPDMGLRFPHASKTSICYATILDKKFKAVSHMISSCLEKKNDTYHQWIAILGYLYSPPFAHLRHLSTVLTNDAAVMLSSVSAAHNQPNTERFWHVHSEYLKVWAWLEHSSHSIYLMRQELSWQVACNKITYINCSLSEFRKTQQQYFM